MTDTPPREPAKRSPPDAIARFWGVAILLVGLASAALVYVLAPDDSGAGAAGGVASGKMYQHTLELMGGKAAVDADRFDQWFASLWQGRTLAYTLAVLALAIALACFWVAYLLSTPPPVNRSPAASSPPDPPSDQSLPR
jgi:hypothetical protein